MKPIVVRTVWVALAALLGFTCLAIFHYPTDADTTWQQRDHSVSLSLATLSQSQHVKWKLQGGNVESSQEQAIIKEDLRINFQPLLDVVPHSFQRQLLSGLPYLWSHPGPEGLFRQSYARLLRLLLDYAHYHHNIQSDPSARTLTWQCTTHEYCGGLGDRLRGVTYALLLAVFSRRRLVVFWEGPEGAFLKPHMINWMDKTLYNLLRRGEDPSYDSPQNLSPFTFSFHVVLDRSGRVRNDITAEDMQYYQRVIGSNQTHVVISTNLEPSSLLDGERSGDQEWIRAGLQWSGLSHLSPTQLDDIMGVAFRYLFRLKTELWEEVELAREVLGLASPTPYTALHVRTGFAGMSHHVELVRHPKLEHNITVWQSSLKCAFQTADRRLGNGSVLFLATDSYLVKDMAVALYGARVRTLRNYLLHVDKLEKESSLELGASEREGVWVVWVEFLLLAQAEVLVRADSGYSVVAGLVAGMDGNRTVHSSNCQ